MSQQTFVLQCFDTVGWAIDVAFKSRLQNDVSCRVEH